MMYRYWKFGICFMGLLSFLSAYAQPLCCNQFFCPQGSRPVLGAHTAVLPPLKTFNSIAVDGPIDVQVFGQADCEQVVVVEPRAVRAEVKGGILFLSAGTRPFAKNRLLVKVYIDRDLRQLSLSHSANIAGECIQSDGLTIYDASCGDLCLRGHIVLNKLISTGTGDIDLQWIDSDAIEVVADNTGNIHLAGRANKLYAKLSGAVVLDAKYLRVKSTWVKSREAARADVSTSEAINVFTDDSATVHYYKGSKTSSYINTQDSAMTFWRY